MSTSPTISAVERDELSRDSFAPGLLGMAERRLIPDAVLRWGIRRMCTQRLEEQRTGGPAVQAARFQLQLAQLRAAEVALHTDVANRQHYELPPQFFAHCLGPRLKYSSACYPSGRETLAEAEDAMLELYGQRAELVDGQDVLELGCGWGSLTLWMAQRYPNSRICAVSNSRLQRQHIEGRCRDLGLKNVSFMTRDVNRLELPASAFDRCVSIEMFEHMRNYETLLARIACWLRPQGKLFVHLFAHRTLMYPFETAGQENWMGRHFFTGGLMPATDTLLWFQRDLQVEQHWQLDGTHYQRTADHWLQNQDHRKSEVMDVLHAFYGNRNARLWFQRWRMFWMACAETFGYDHGREWVIAHYRLAHRE
ncbi:MAG TPA: class I SAM-dependent methyltransferase [Steroidobacteraceae bacterium]|jgi:cyclopropane-fatty-acyl-phospholipid synthase|nr:class I SAM-dependent methyltransferase [Steroidobacteraceae bacterium]